MTFVHQMYLCVQYANEFFSAFGEAISRWWSWVDTPLLEIVYWLVGITLGVAIAGTLGKKIASLIVAFL